MNVNSISFQGGKNEYNKTNAGKTTAVALLAAGTGAKIVLKSIEDVKNADAKFKLSFKNLKTVTRDTYKVNNPEFKNLSKNLNKNFKLSNFKLGKLLGFSVIAGTAIGIGALIDHITNKRAAKKTNLA